MRNSLGPTSRKEFPMKRVSNRKRHRPEEIVAKLREADEARAQGRTLEELAASSLRIKVPVVQKISA